METVLVEEADGIATVTINRPQVKNAADRATWERLGQVFAELGYRDEVRAIILTGAGGDFCSGADVSSMGAGTNRPHWLQFMRMVGDTCRSVFETPKVTIARVEGVAVGAGMNLALACDLVVASEHARFGEVFAKRGLSVDFGGSFLLPRIIGMQRAKELVLLAEIFDAREAERIGLCTHVLADDELDGKVAELAGKAAAGPPRAIAMSKAMLNASFTTTLTEALEKEGVAQTVNFGLADAKEAIVAFQEKRDTSFTGW